MLKNKFLLVIVLTFNLEADSSYGSLFFHGNCIACHYESKAIAAPSFIEIQEHYKRAFPKKEDFVEYMSTWVSNPKEETSIMLDAIQKYGLMPELAFRKDVLKDISAYVYDTNFTKNTQSTNTN